MKKTAECPMGYYCPRNTGDLTDDHICPVGYKCPEGSADKQPCGEGYYQDKSHQGVCKECLAG